MERTDGADDAMRRRTVRYSLLRSRVGSRVVAHRKIVVLPNTPLRVNAEISNSIGAVVHGYVSHRIGA